MESSLESVTFRNAVLADVPALCGLLALLFAQESEFSPDEKRQAKGLRLILDDPETGRIHCAVAGHTIVGMVSVLFNPSTAEGGLAAWLEDMVVHPDWRGLKLGGHLLQVAILEARAAGCVRITLLTDATNAGAMRLYERVGFTRSAMAPFRLKL